MSTEAPGAVESAITAGLRYVNDGERGIRRWKTGRGFTYVDANGKRVQDERTLRRIKSVVIPPAWTDVWICSSNRGHIQATGRDAKGRKQYRYHPAWRAVRDETKFDRMVAFGETLPLIRSQVNVALAQPGLSREKVLATVVRLLDLTLIRVGNDEYARKNRSYGLTTLRENHVNVSGDHIRFHFRGKSGKEHLIELEDRTLARIVRRCQEIPGHELFHYVDEQDRPRVVESGDVNEYLRAIASRDFSAKDFRTWAGTVLAASELAACPAWTSERQAKQLVVGAIRSVAERLGNTPAVCRKSYVHPVVIATFLEAEPGPRGPQAAPKRYATAAKARPSPAKSQGLDRNERAVLALLRRYAKSVALRASA